MLKNGATKVTNCDIPCKGNLFEFCGGSNAMNVYVLPNSVSTPLIDSTPVPTSSFPPLPTAITLTTSPAPSTMSTAAATITSKPAPKLTSNRQSELIINGIFTDTTGKGWSLTSSPDGLSSAALDGQLVSDDQGNNAYNISSNPYRASKRSLCVTQTFSYPKAGVFSLTSQVGRYIPAGKAAVTDDQLWYNIFVDRQSVTSGDVCDPALRGCATSGAYGGYNIVTAIVQASAADLQSGSHNLSVCAVFTTRATSEVLDSFLISSVSLFGPRMGG